MKSRTCCLCLNRTTYDGDNPRTDYRQPHERGRRLDRALILSGHRRFISARKAADIIAGTGGLGDETDVALAFGVLHARSESGIALYPFKFSRLGIEVDHEVVRGPYATLLIVGVLIWAIAFEALGKCRTRTRAIRRPCRSWTVWEIDEVSEIWSPARGCASPCLAEAITWLAGQLRVPSYPLRGGSLNRADGGIDVVAWRDFGDLRPPAPVAAVQVTYEGDLRGKSLEIAANDMSRWMDLAPPVAVLAVPFDGEDDPDLYADLALGCWSLTGGACWRV